MWPGIDPMHSGHTAFLECLEHIRLMPSSLNQVSQAKTACNVRHIKEYTYGIFGFVVAALITLSSRDWKKKRRQRTKI